ncbi:MAG: MucB/RseB C-terminal domain-containing protein [Rhizobiales bacterium]|nr:MucB/RseB C-terminal domain-containing protein [Rhizobacter sp.]
MLTRPFWTLAFAGFFCIAAPSAWSQASVAAGGDAQAREVRAWLLRIHEAASQRNFQGTFVVSGGGAVSSARIAHFCEGPNQFERSEALDGQARHVYRHNDVVTTVWPGSKTAMVEQRNLLAQFPALLQAGDDRIADFYDVHPQGADRVAGREANVLVVKPRDAYRYGYRLWADQDSGLLLRADVIGERSEVLESSAFSDVTIGVKPQPESVLQPMKKLEGYRVVRPVLVPTKLEAEGWAMRKSVPGFRQVSCVKRPIDGAAERSAAAGPQVLQTIFSDGLTYVSLFIEPFDPQRHTRPMLASVGPTQTLMQQQGDWWVTVVGDVPPATLRLFAKGLERSKKQ